MVDRVRRSVVLALGVGLAGCSTDLLPSDSGGQGDPAGGGEDGSEPTVIDSPEPAEEFQRLEFGEWMSVREEYGFTVTGFERRDSFYDESEKNQRVLVPGDNTFLIVHIKAKNITREPLMHPMDNGWGAIVDGQVFESTGGFDHPEYDDGFSITWTSFAWDHRHLSPYGGLQQMESGEVLPFWYGCLIPENVPDSAIVPAYRPASVSGRSRRWYPG